MLLVNFKRILISLLSFVALNSAILYADTPFKEDIDFRQVKASSLELITDLSQLDQVVDIEVYYWYGCKACYQLEVALEGYIQKHPQLKVRRVPLVAYTSWRSQAYLQPLMTELANNNLEVVDKFDLYKACLQDCSQFSSFEASKDWLKAFKQINELPHINESEIWRKEKIYRNRADSFSISQVPTILIKERFAIDADSAKNVDRFIQIIDFLLTQGAR